MENDSNKVLYISPDGILEPLGDSQVLKYLEKLSEQFNITLISYEKKNDLKEIEKLQQIQARCEGHNICWNYKPYRQGKFIISHAINVLNFVFFPILLMWKNKYSIVHIRSYMPGLSIPLLSLIFNFKLLFDIRGFWADEKVDTVTPRFWPLVRFYLPQVGPRLGSCRRRRTCQVTVLKPRNPH